MNTNKSEYPFFIDQNGEILLFDIFSSYGNNYNGVIFGNSGAGKSFFAENLAHQEWEKGSKIRIIDIGKTYKKVCQKVNGKFVNLSKDSSICFNPFPYINIYVDISSTVSVVAQMIISDTKRNLDEIEFGIIKEAVQDVYEIYADEGDITKVYETLLNPEKFITNNQMIDLSKALALSIKPFTCHGEFGNWFNGPINFDFIYDEFMVFELEELFLQPNLLSVVALQLVNIVNGRRPLEFMQRMPEGVFT